MPKWVPVEVVGILMQDTHGLILELPGGGWWRLEDIWRVKSSLLGTRVTIKGTRIGFNVISVDKIAPA